ncbi:tRNA pseudouridine(55) synthase TruB [Alloscardovia venturai]|uniref:tRNA pseudouridine synthase B n=1 Tax=Alloscardovia venturai TaxID=1769421 RepID=A0ABW2Y7J0_9BIFI
MLSSGVIIVDKPQGATSHDVVAACRSLLHTSKVGHAGTLDPMATGTLVVGFGSATRLLNAIVGTDKTYITTIHLGDSSTTDDADGEIVNLSAEQRVAVDLRLAAITPADIYREVSQLTGAIEQIPSTYSAKKINGKRAYDLARRGEHVELNSRTVTVSDFHVESIRRMESGHIEVDAQITCSAGTYIRALGRDLGSALGVGGYLTMLRRTRVGKFSVNDAKTIVFEAREHEFTDKTGARVKRVKAYAPTDIRDGARLSQSIITPAQAATLTMPTYNLTPQQAIDISFGRPLKVALEELSAALYDGHLMALIEPWKNNTQAKPTTVFITAADLAALMQA